MSWPFSVQVPQANLPPKQSLARQQLPWLLAVSGIAARAVTTSASRNKQVFSATRTLSIRVSFPERADPRSRAQGVSCPAVQRFIPEPGHRAIIEPNRHGKRQEDHVLQHVQARAAAQGEGEPAAADTAGRKVEITDQGDGENGQQ